MASLWGQVFNSASQTAAVDVLQDLKVIVDGTARFTEAVVGDGRRTRVVRIFTDTDCHFKVGSIAVDADVNDRPLGVENPEYILVREGDTIGVIQRV